MHKKRKRSYSPNHEARALVKKRSNCIGIIVNNLHDPFFHDLIKGFEMSAQQTKRGGAVIWGGIRGVEQMKKIGTQWIIC